LGWGGNLTETQRTKLRPGAGKSVDSKGKERKSARRGSHVREQRSFRKKDTALRTEKTKRQEKNQYGVGQAKRGGCLCQKGWHELT